MTNDRFDHATRSREWAEAAERPDLDAELTSSFAQIAIAHAQLALVEQQRIQNLIALEALQKPAFHSSYLMHNAQTNIDAHNAMYRLRPTIAAALGIGEAS